MAERLELFLGTSRQVTGLLGQRPFLLGELPLFPFEHRLHPSERLVPLGQFIELLQLCTGRGLALGQFLTVGLQRVDLLGQRRHLLL